METVLVTGGSGLVGKAMQDLKNHVCDTCGEYEKICFDCELPSKLCRNCKGQLDEYCICDTPKHFRIIYLSSKECDLRDDASVDKVFQLYNPGIVVHLANRVGGLYMNMNNNYTILVDNLKINVNVLECCKKYKVKRLINILSTCVFPASCTLPLTSDQINNGPPHPSNEGYSISKRILHTGSELLSKESDIEIVNLTPTNLYGTNDNYNLNDSHIIPALIHKTYLAKLNNTDLYIKGTGIACRQFVLASDFAKIIFKFIRLKLDKSFNSVIVGPPKEDEITIKEVVNKLTEIFDFKGPINYDASCSDGMLKKTVSNQELDELLPNFSFTGLAEGLKLTAKYFVNNYESIRK